MRYIATTAALALFALPALAQNFTTSAEVRPILDATRGNWVAVRLYDGQDLLYFTHLEAWRCGLEQVRFSVNGGKLQVWEMEPCYEDEAVPNAIKAEGRLPFLTLSPNSVERVKVDVTYDDGTRDSVAFERSEIQIN